jgi:hypothetical protein
MLNEGQLAAIKKASFEDRFGTGNHLRRIAKNTSCFWANLHHDGPKIGRAHRLCRRFFESDRIYTTPRLWLSGGPGPESQLHHS